MTSQFQCRNTFHEKVFFYQPPPLLPENFNCQNLNLHKRKKVRKSKKKTEIYFLDKLNFSCTFLPL